MPLSERVLDLVGVLVVAYDEGLQLGNVSDIYLDRETSRITGMSVKKGLPGFVTSSYVDFKDIRKLGKDVVIVKSQAAVTPLPDGIEKKSLRLLRNVRVATQGGEYVGRLHDVSVVVANGDLSQLILSESEYLNIVPKTTAIGSDIIVIPSGSRKKTGKIAHRTTDAKKSIDAVTDMIESATNKVMEAAKQTTGRVIKTTKLTADKARKAGRDAINPNRESKNTTAAEKTGKPRAKKAKRR